MWLLINKETGQAKVERDPSFDDLERLKGLGFEVIWDSVPSERRGYEYAAEFYNAHQHECRHCGHFVATDKCTGNRYSDAHGRWIVYRNVRICEQCQQGPEIHVKERRVES